MIASHDPLSFVSSSGATEQPLPGNMTFTYSKLADGAYAVSLSGYTAGPPAAINSPQMIVSGYNPAAFFNGWSLGGQYGAYAMAYLGEDDDAATLYLQGWINSVSGGGVFERIDYQFPL